MMVYHHIIIINIVMITVAGLNNSSWERNPFTYRRRWWLPLDDGASASGGPGVHSPHCIVARRSLRCLWLVTAFGIFLLTIRSLIHLNIRFLLSYPWRHRPPTQQRLVIVTVPVFRSVVLAPTALSAEFVSKVDFRSTIANENSDRCRTNRR